MKQLSLFALLLIACYFYSCKSHDQASSARKETVSLPPSNGNSVLIAKVIKIHDERSEVFPCSEVACTATVKIEKVEKASGNLLEPFASGQEGKMRFEFTLSETTEKLFPNLDKRLPGLKKGDRFKVNAAQEVVFGSGKVQWVAFDYILLP